MAILFHDGFDHYGAGAISGTVSQAGGFVASGYEQLTQSVTLNESFSRYTAAKTGSAVSLGASFLTGARNTANSNDPIWIKRAIPVWQDLLVVGFGCRVNVKPSTDTEIFEMNSALNITVLPDMSVKVFNKLADYKLEVGVYYFFEIQIDEAGNGTLWISQNQVAEATGLDTAFTHWHLMARVPNTSVSNIVNFDDVYLLDGSGETNTSRLGRTNSIIRIPTATVEAGFSVSSGTALNHTYVNKLTPMGDTSYVKESKSVRDLYGNNTAVQTTKEIMAVSIITNSRRDEFDNFKIRPIMKSGDSEAEGAEYPLVTYNYTGNSQVFEVDPATDLKWTVAGLQAASWGQKLWAPPVD